MQKDYLCFYYGGESNVYPDSRAAERPDQLTLVPMITIDPTQPKAGQELLIEIAANYGIRDLATDALIGHDSVKINDAKVIFNNQEFFTDEEGQVRIPSHLVTEGKHTIKVSKDIENSYPRLVRWEQTIEIGSRDTGHDGAAPGT